MTQPLTDETKQARMAEIEHLVAVQDAGLFDALAGLLEEAKRLGDAVLEGFVHYQYASAYFDLEDEVRMLESLQSALGLLLIHEAGEWVARSCNLFAVYAKQIGCLNMAYNYYLLGLSYVEKKEGSLSRAMLESNIGDLLADIGEYRSACTYTRKGLKSLKQGSGQPQFRMYEAFGTVNLGLFLLYSGDTARARKTIARGARLLKQQENNAGEATLFWLKVVEAQLELAEGNSAAMLSLTGEVATLIETKPVFALFTRELQQFGNVLIAAREWEAADMLIGSLESADYSASSVYSKLMIARLKADYFRETGDAKALKAAREERHLLTKEIGRAQKSLFRKSIRLMEMNETLRAERDRIRQENELLKEQALTDALTGLPNRYALNAKMERAFEEAYQNRTMLGFGIVDIDTFKQFNDQYGHVAGDTCLREVADSLKEIAKEYGFFVSRYGGDEFTIVSDRTDPETMNRIGEEITKRVSVRVSYGYHAAVPDESVRQWDYLTKADSMMYRRKRGHGNGF